MKVFCVYTKQHKESVRGMERCRKSCSNYNVDFIPYPAIHYSDMKKAQEELGIKSKYSPVAGSATDFVRRTAPRTRIANGTTHYKLYLECIELDEPIIIVEHDAYFVSEPPEVSDKNAIVQISSHNKDQLTPALFKQCGRANKMKKYGKVMKPYRDWSGEKGIIPHPLSGTNGTSGYVIGPGAARRMIEYIKQDGVGFADRLREDHIGEGNLYLQVPQSVLCPNDIKSTGLN